MKANSADEPAGFGAFSQCQNTSEGKGGETKTISSEITRPLSGTGRGVTVGGTAPFGTTCSRRARWTIPGRSALRPCPGREVLNFGPAGHARVFAELFA